MTRAARIAVLVGGVGSVALMFRAGYRGRGNPPPFLMVLFTFWVLSPYVLLWWASALSRRWSASTRTALEVVTLIVAIASLAVYGYFAFGPPRAQVAPPFVVVPPASWLLTAIAVATTALVSRRGARQRPAGDGA